MERECGDCIACCDVPNIDALNKPACTPCENLKDNLCSIQDTKPQQCIDFNCLWKFGFGELDDRPDKSKVMTWNNNMNGGQWILVTNLEPEAHRTTGKRMINTVVDYFDYPAIIVEHENLVDGKGDYVIIKDSLQPRASRIRGPHIEDMEYILEMVN